MMHSEDLCNEEVVRSFERYDKVIEALRMRRFMLLRDNVSGFEVYLFRGQNRDYILIPCEWCTCHDFTINVLSRGLKPLCYHLAGLELAKRSNRLQVIEIDIETITKILEEILVYGFSLTLRKLAKF